MSFMQRSVRIGWLGTDWPYTYLDVLEMGESVMNGLLLSQGIFLNFMCLSCVRKKVSL